jgi:hypothetical protein
VGLDPTGSHVLEGPGREFPNLLLVAVEVISELHRGVQVCWRLDVRVIQHGNDAHKNGLNAQDWSPSFLCSLLSIHGVHTWGVKDRNANLSIRVNIWMPHLSFESHLRRVVGIVVWELELRLKIPSFIEGVFWPLEDNVPQEKIIIVLEPDRCIEIISLLNVY